MGMPLKEVVTRVTASPARVIRRPSLGQLSKGSVADICVYDIQEGLFGFLDVRGFKLEGSKRIQNLMTIRAGKVVWDLNGLSAPDWKTEIR